MQEKLQLLPQPNTQKKKKGCEIIINGQDDDFTRETNLNYVCLTNATRHTKTKTTRSIVGLEQYINTTKVSKQPVTCLYCRNYQCGSCSAI